MAISGAAHYAWKTENVTDKDGRQRARRMYPNIGLCTRCGSKKSERHHIDGNPQNNARENISILCRKCHMVVDKRTEKYATPYNNGLAKLSYEKAREIRASKETCSALAQKYGVSINLISLVRLNKIWKERDFESREDAYSDYLLDVSRP